MGFLIFHPTSQKLPLGLRTTNDLVLQVWQELVMRRHAYKKHKVIKNVSPWIHQARTYFVDATKSNWKSAGLLYYYSFLNLAKAFLAEKRILHGAH